MITTTKQEMISLFRCAFNNISKLELINITADVTYHTDRGICITVFDTYDDNASFYAYYHQTKDKNKEIINCVIEAIKLDDFTSVKDVLKIVEMKGYDYEEDVIV